MEERLENTREMLFAATIIEINETEEILLNNTRLDGRMGKVLKISK